MANPIAESILALLAGAAPAYAATRAARGAENRSLQTSLMGQQEKRKQQTQEFGFEQQKFGAENKYRAAVLAGNQAESAATADYRGKELQLRQGELNNKSEFDRLQQDSQNQLSLERLRTQGMMNQMQVMEEQMQLLRAGGGKNGKIDRYDAETQYRQGILDLIKNPDISTEKKIKVKSADGKVSLVSQLDQRAAALRDNLGLNDSADSSIDPIKMAEEIAAAIAGRGAGAGADSSVFNGNQVIGGGDTSIYSGYRYPMNLPTSYVPPAGHLTDVLSGLNKRQMQAPKLRTQ